MLFFVQKAQVLGGEATERSIEKPIMSSIFFPVSEEHKAAAIEKNSSSGAIDWLMDHVKLLKRELHLTVADLTMFVICLAGAGIS